MPLQYRIRWSYWGKRALRIHTLGKAESLFALVIFHGGNYFFNRYFCKHSGKSTPELSISIKECPKPTTPFHNPICSDICPPSLSTYFSAFRKISSEGDDFRQYFFQFRSVFFRLPHLSPINFLFLFCDRTSA